jgi:hypothetical protein
MTDGFRVSACIDIPVGANLEHKKIIFQKKILAEYTIYFNGERNIRFVEVLYEDEVEERLSSMLNTYILDIYGNLDALKDLNGKRCSKEDKVEALLFSLAHPEFSAFEFLFWDIPENSLRFAKKRGITPKKALSYLLGERKEKSVKRALYENYRYFQ